MNANLYYQLNGKDHKVELIDVEYDEVLEVLDGLRDRERDEEGERARKADEARRRDNETITIRKADIIEMREDVILGAHPLDTERVITVKYRPRTASDVMQEELAKVLRVPHSLLYGKKPSSADLHDFGLPSCGTPPRPHLRPKTGEEIYADILRTHNELTKRREVVNLHVPVEVKIGDVVSTPTDLGAHKHEETPTPTGGVKRNPCAATALYVIGQLKPERELFGKEAPEQDKVEVSDGKYTYVFLRCDGSTIGGTAKGCAYPELSQICRGIGLKKSDFFFDIPALPEIEGAFICADVREVEDADEE